MRATFVQPRVADFQSKTFVAAKSKTSAPDSTIDEIPPVRGDSSFRLDNVTSVADEASDRRWPWRTCRCCCCSRPRRPGLTTLPSAAGRCYPVARAPRRAWISCKAPSCLRVRAQHVLHPARRALRGEQHRSAHDLRLGNLRTRRGARERQLRSAAGVAFLPRGHRVPAAPRRRERRVRASSC